MGDIQCLGYSCDSTDGKLACIHNNTYKAEYQTPIPLPKKHTQNILQILLFFNYYY